MGRVKTYSEFINESKTVSQFLQTKEDIDYWLSHKLKMPIFKYTINDDLTVDVVNDVNISNEGLEFIPVQFDVVEGDFLCQLNNLTSLKGCPVGVILDFYCYHNRLTSLEGCPEEVGGEFCCDDNRLTSLVFAPKMPDTYNNNPCTKIYKKLGWSVEAHTEALKTLDPNPIETIQRLKKYKPSLAKELGIVFGMESEELKQAYDVSKNVEGDFY